MSYLVIFPSGALHVNDVALSAKTDQAVPVSLQKAFEKSIGQGFFALACYKNRSELTTELRYWQQLSYAYMTARCRNEPAPNQDAQVIALTPAPFILLPDIGSMLQAPPIMDGAEYLALETLSSVWTQLDHYVCDQVNKAHLSLKDFLKQKAPQWHQIGRVCLHLAENTQDPEYPFAFMATYVGELNAQNQATYHPLGHIIKRLAKDNKKTELMNILSPLDLATTTSELLKAVVANDDIYHPLAWTAQQAFTFFKEVSSYEEAGLMVRLPDWWRKRAQLKVSVDIGHTAKNALDVDALLDFQISKTLAGQQLSEQEWQQLMAAEDELIFFKGQWVEVNKSKLQSTLDQWHKVEAGVHQDGLSFAQSMRLLAGAPIDLNSNQTANTPEWLSIQAGPALATMLEQLRHPAAIKPNALGKSLQASLRPYQQKGLEWLWSLTQIKLGACLADDMGLGKTIQVIALLLMYQKKYKNKPDKKPSLLVLPASLLNNWNDEIKKFAPSLRCLFVHPSFNTSLPEAKDCEQYDLVLTTYGILTRQAWFSDYDWQLIILDEAQAIKNPGTKQTKAVKALQAQARIALTGTPVENKPSDLWSLFDFICPGLLGSAKRFQDFTKSLSSREHDIYEPLRKLVQPYILRRMKTDKTIISDLPDKVEMNTYYQLTKKQAALYQNAVQELRSSLVNAEGIQRKGLVLSFLMTFKQICNHPAQRLGNGDYSPKDSGKFLRLAELCADIAARHEKVLVFTQFRSITAPLAEFLSQCFGRPGLVLHGGTSVKQRKQCVDAFQQETGPPFFVLSVKAGGTGLNLTNASHVIHFDRWWNPAVENQATDRAFRIGQQRNVMVHKMVCKGTIEEKIDQLIAEKQGLAQDILSQGSESLLTEMSNDALLDLVMLDINQVST